MKKIHRAIKQGNIWKRKTRWQLDAEDCISAGILLLVVGFVVIRALLG